MTSFKCEFSISYTGSDADDHQIEAYDIAHALVGFQRSLALTTHLVLHNEIITQAPALRGAAIYSLPPEEGSWKFKLIVIGALTTGTYNLLTAPRDTPLGNLVYSAYDYLISETLGFHVDYSKTLQQQYEEVHRQAPDLPIANEERFDSLIEKCEVAIREIHRPIVKSETADQARIFARSRAKEVPLTPVFDEETYRYLLDTTRSDRPLSHYGQVSSYNSNTYKGRIFIGNFGRPIPFELSLT